VVEEIVGEFVLMSRLKGNSHIVSYEDHQVIRHTEDIGWDILIRMELLTPLLRYIREKPLTKKDIIQLGIDMCKALELCQKFKIIHRDIKPENIFIAPERRLQAGRFRHCPHHR
jgi:serine/threonine protein kinase